MLDSEPSTDVAAVRNGRNATPSGVVMVSGTSHCTQATAPPLSRPAVGAVVGGLGAHLWRGLSRSDVKDLGELIDDGQAALLVVGESTVQQAVEKANLKAEKHIAKELNISTKEITNAVREAAADVS